MPTMVEIQGMIIKTVKALVERSKADTDKKLEQLAGKAHNFRQLLREKDRILDEVRKENDNLKKQIAENERAPKRVSPPV
jgi:peptidoglycan hydrolase CwlO-like protein